jgi:elongation factor P
MATIINGNAIRVGYLIRYKNEIYRVLTTDVQKPGKGPSYLQGKLRNIIQGNQTEVRFRSDERVERIAMEQQEMEFLYEDPSGFFFMNTETYDQISLDKDTVADAVKYLTPNLKVHIEFFEGKPLNVILPKVVVLKIMETEPPMKGATASGSGKPAKCETGLTVNVPNFIEAGEVVRVDTEEGKYLERAK